MVSHCLGLYCGSFFGSPDSSEDELDESLEEDESLDDDELESFLLSLLSSSLELDELELDDDDDEEELDDEESTSWL